MREIFGTSVQCCTCWLHKLVQKLQKVHPPFSKNKAALALNLGFLSRSFTRVRDTQFYKLNYGFLRLYPADLLLYCFFWTPHRKVLQCEMEEVEEI